MDIETELEKLIEKHKDQQVGVGQTRIDWVAEDCLREIRMLKDVISHFQNNTTTIKTLKFYDWDSEDCYEKIKTVHTCGECKYIVAENGEQFPNFCPNCGRKITR